MSRFTPVNLSDLFVHIASHFVLAKDEGSSYLLLGSGKLSMDELRKKELSASHATTLVWCLDDYLRYIPMAALHDGQQYLAAKYRNVILTDSSDVGGSSTVQLKAIAAGVSEAREGLPALPGVSQELHAIFYQEGAPAQDSVVPASILVNGDFTQDALRAALYKKDYSMSTQPSRIARPQSPYLRGMSTEPFVSADEAASFLAVKRRYLLALARNGIAGAYALGTGTVRKVGCFGSRNWRLRLRAKTVIPKCGNCAILHLAVPAEKRKHGLSARKFESSETQGRSHLGAALPGYGFGQ